MEWKMKVIFCEHSAFQYFQYLEKKFTLNENKMNKKLGRNTPARTKDTPLVKKSPNNKESFLLNLLNDVYEMYAKRDLNQQNYDKKYYLVVDGEGDVKRHIKEPIVKWKKNNKEKYEKIKDKTFIVLNNPCLEYYFLLHFEKKHQVDWCADAVIKCLKTHLRDYQKMDKNNFDRIEPNFENFNKHIKGHDIYEKNKDFIDKSIAEINQIKMDDSEFNPFTNILELRKKLSWVNNG
jgi:hypothetical protein